MLIVSQNQNGQRAPNTGLAGSNSAGSLSNNTNGSQPGKKVGPEDFATLKLIGKGGFGRVLLVRKNDSKQVRLLRLAGIGRLARDYCLLNS